MNEKEKKQKVQTIADVITDLLQQVDIFTQVLTTEDFEILEEAKGSLKEKITYKQSAMTLLLAIGAEADTTEDKMKLETLNLLIDLIKTRIEYREKMLEMESRSAKKNETINMLKSMGIL